MTKARKRCWHDNPGAWVETTGGDTMKIVPKSALKDCPYCQKRKKAANEE